MPAAFTKCVDYEHRRIALTLFLNPVIGGGSIIATVGKSGVGFSYQSKSDYAEPWKHYTLRFNEVGGIVRGEVYALMTLAIGTITIVEYLDDRL